MGPGAGYLYALYANVGYDETSNLHAKVCRKRKGKTTNSKQVLPATSPRGVIHEVRTLALLLDSQSERDDDRADGGR